MKAVWFSCLSLLVVMVFHNKRKYNKRVFKVKIEQMFDALSWELCEKSISSEMQILVGAFDFNLLLFFLFTLRCLYIVLVDNMQRVY